MRTTLVLTLTLALTLGLAASAWGDDEEKEGATVLDHEMKTIDGETVNLAKKYAGKVVLVVNVASRCGYTPQYADLQKLHEKYGDKGLAVLGFPCNQFGRQEPGSETEIKEFCSKNYGVEFDMFAKIDVKGPKQAPLYEQLSAYEKDAGDVKWNFEKFLIGRDGEVVARMRSNVNPTAADVAKLIEKELAKK